MKLEEEIKQAKFRSSRHKAIVNIFYTYSWLNEKHFTVIKPLDITVQQFNILRILRGQYPVPANIKLLKERMIDKMSDASRLVEKLRQKELIERNPCAADRRSVDVIISEKGLKLLEDIDKFDTQFDNLLSSLTDTEVDDLNNLLDKMRG